MPQQATVYRIFIASPSDVVEERKAIPEVISSWNAVNSLSHGVVLRPVSLETDASPEMGDRPQAIINKLVENSDILIGIFWTRLGTHTGKAESGTVEEIEEFIKAGKPVLLYFSSVPVVPDNIDVEQHKKLLEFKGQCQKKGLVFSYKSIGELREQLQGHITSTIDSLDKVSTEVTRKEEAGEDDTQQTKVRYGKLKVRMNDRNRVEAIERDDKTPNWIEKHQQANQGKLPPLPKWLYPVLNIRDEKGYRTLTDDNGSYIVSKDIEVTAPSGQYWNQLLTNDQREELLELVEWLADPHYPTAHEYVRYFESMYPRDPDFSKRKALGITLKPFEQR